MKFRTIKISSEGLGGNYTKFCTRENFPLYGINCERRKDLQFAITVVSQVSAHGHTCNSLFFTTMGATMCQISTKLVGGVNA